MKTIISIFFPFWFVPAHSQKLGSIQNLKPLSIVNHRLVEKKFGIKSEPGIFEFNEGPHNPNDTFEIAQVIKLPDVLTKITSIHLFLSGAFDSIATFRVKFYSFNGEYPAEILVQKNIIRTCLLNKPWLDIDLRDLDIRLKGTVVAALEYIPSKERPNKAILYNVKIGGSSRTFVKSNGWLKTQSTKAKWEIPPAHYRLYVSALVAENTKVNNQEELSIVPSAVYSPFVKDSFSIFVSLPKHYKPHSKRKYPCVYVLDANIFVEQLATIVNLMIEKKQLPEIIVLGIGYKDFIISDSLRERDYTFFNAGTADSIRLSGGGRNFLQFIEKELIPNVDLKYNTDTSSRALLGHSLAGHFVLEVLHRTMVDNSHTFNKFVSASPSMEINKAELLGKLGNEKNLSKNILSVFLTMGGLEYDELENVHLLSKKFADKHTNVKCETLLLPYHEHMSTPYPSFEKGLQYLFQKP